MLILIDSLYIALSVIVLELAFALFDIPLTADGEQRAFAWAFSGVLILLMNHA